MRQRSSRELKGERHRERERGRERESERERQRERDRERAKQRCDSTYIKLKPSIIVMFLIMSFFYFTQKKASYSLVNPPLQERGCHGEFSKNENHISHIPTPSIYETAMYTARTQTYTHTNQTQTHTHTPYTDNQ